MQKLCLGIILLSLIALIGCDQQIQPTSPKSIISEPVKIGLSECAPYADKLDSCEPFSCEFQHPITGEMMEKKIIGLVNGKCKYTEEMPAGARVNCEYSESARKVIAQFQRDVDAGEVKSAYIINSKSVQNPMQEAADIGQCRISGITDIPLPEKTPEFKMGFQGSKSCKIITECLRPTPLCFEGYCVTANEALRNYIFANYEYGNCLNKKCAGCEKGVLQPATIGQDEYKIDYCIECSDNNVFRCKQGYECMKGKCIGSPSPECSVNSDCTSTQICQNNQCAELQCTSCRTIQNHACAPLACCSDSDCDDRNANTVDKCISPGTTDARCVTTLIEPENQQQICSADTDCSAGKFCFAKSCLTTNEFYSQYTGCCDELATVYGVPECEHIRSLTSNIRDCSEITCNNCISEKQKCISLLKNTEIQYINYCAECTTNTDCKQGYACKNRTCTAA